MHNLASLYVIHYRKYFITKPFKWEWLSITGFYVCLHENGLNRPCDLNGCENLFFVTEECPYEMTNKLYNNEGYKVVKTMYNSSSHKD
jgi:hypothetical protein